MALINCPECNKQISNKAENCPNCGYPITAGETTHVKGDTTISPTVVVKPKEGCFLQTLNVGCIFFAIIIIVIIIFTIFLFIAVFN